MKPGVKISDILNSGDLFSINEQISEIKYTIEACNSDTNFSSSYEFEKMKYHLAILEDIRTRIIAQHDF